MTTDQTEARRVAAGLSEAQKLAILAMDPCDPPVIRKSIEELMLADGLIGYETEAEIYLNDFGLAVRAVLAEAGK